MTRFLFLLSVPLALALTACATTSTSTDNSAAIATAVASSDRPSEARELDESRKPAEVLAFLGLTPGMDAADVITGTGYWAEIMGHVVGPQGAVTALQPEQFYTGAEDRAKLDAMLARASAVKMVRYPFERFAHPANAFDFAIINLSYHDLYWESEEFKIPRTDPDAFLRGLYAAMRPGGVVGVIDHVGHGTDTRKLVDTLHRIDPAVVRADFERAGFVLDATSDILANPADDHSKLVFDASIRGKTDRILYRFRKPG